MNVIEKAKLCIDEGNYKEAEKILEPLVKEDNAEAIFLSSSFSKGRSESIQEFEKRSFSLIEKAADLGFPEALYTLGVIYESGDGIKSDIVKASSLFCQAAKLGHSRSKLSYGLDLYYGTNGIAQDKLYGKRMIKEAADESVEAASTILQGIMEKENSLSNDDDI